MKTFKDNTGREWKLVLNVYAMKQLRERLGVDLVNVIQLDKSGEVKVDLIDRIANDPCLLVDNLWVLCEEQAKVADVTDVAFGSALAGDAIEEATKAFLDELVDFFPGAKRLFLRKAIQFAQKYSGEMTEKLEAALESPELEERLRAALNSSTNSPE